MPIFSLKNITKEFPGVVALKDVSLDIEQGEIHALVGENGAGKSTLIKIMGGVWPYGSYSGQMLVAGKEIRFHHVHESGVAQIQIIYQELSLVNEMSVTENIFLGNELVHAGVMDYNSMRKKAQESLDLLKCNIRPEQKVGDLTIGQQQIVEIAKALSKSARIIVFDEPTAALPEKDVENLLELIIDLKKKKLGIIYITHKLNEVNAIADTVTVLRNGERISVFKKGNINVNSIVHDMIGRSIEKTFPDVKPHGKLEVLKLNNVTLYDPIHKARKILRNVSITCCEGEVLGIAGLLGSGRTALLSLLFGVFRGYFEGEIMLYNESYKPLSPDDAIKKGIALVSEDRKQFGLVSTSDIKENLCLASLSRYLRYKIINHTEVISQCNKYISDLNIKTPSLVFPVQNLSGGNQQKVILGRFLMTKPKLLLLDDPTRGVDVGAKYEIYRLIHALAEEGIAIIFVSSELPEVLGVSHRTYILQGGKIRDQFERGQKSEEEVLAMAAGV